MASKLKVDELAGSAGNTISLASGQTLDTSSGTLTLGTGAVTSAMLAGSIANTKLSNSTITIGDESSNVFDINLGDEFSIIGGEGIDTTLTGNLLTVAGEDATTSNKGIASFSSDNFAVSSGAVTIKDGGIVHAELANDAVDGDNIADDSINSEHYVDGSIDTAHIADNQITTAKILDANVTLAKIANAAANTVIVRDANSSGVLSAKAVTDTQILIGDGTGFTAAALSGDVTMTNAGAVTIANASVEHAMMANDAVDGDIIADDSINSEHYVDGSIDTAHIADDQITEAKMADDAISSVQLKSLVTINILASDGSTVVKTIFTPGS